MSKEEVLSLALALPAEDRAALAYEILHSLEPAESTPADWEQAWSAELQARAERLDRGETTARDWREVVSELRSGLKRTGRP